MTERGSSTAETRARSRWSPRSLSGLVTFSFALVGLPLIVVVLASAYAVNRLSGQTEDTVYQAVQLTQGSLILMEELVTMERSARQYQIVADPGLMEVFKTSHEQFRRTLKRLEALRVAPSLATRVRRLGQGESDLVQSILASPSDQLPGQLGQSFNYLSDQAHALWTDSSQMVSQRVDTLRADARRLQQFLLWGALILVLVSVILAFALSRLILGPVRQIDHAIHRLGGGDFEQAVSVRGPRDLEYLGERLDWTRRRLLELEAGKQRFLRDVSHDLKTPLTTLLESVELLQDQVVGSLNAEQTGLVRILHASAGQLQSRIDQLIQYNRLQGQFASLDLRTLDLSRLVSSSLSEHRPALEGRNLSVVRTLDPARLWGDETKLRQVIDNLLSNAIKYAPRGSNVYIDVRADAQKVTLRVADQGPGVEVGDRDRLFEAFYRGTPPSDGAGSGSGVGLAIVKEYVEAHHGVVRLVAGREGEGAVFKVEIPTDMRGLET